MSPYGHPVALSAHTSLDSGINAKGSASDLHFCVGFRGSKKVEKHWYGPMPVILPRRRPTLALGLLGRCFRAILKGRIHIK